MRPAGLARRWHCVTPAKEATLGLLGRDKDRLGKVADECRRLGAEVSTSSLDVRARPEMKRWLCEFDTNTPIDILIANAGVMSGRAGTAEIKSPDASHALMETNVLGVLNSVQPVLLRMMARGYGQIGIMSSLAAFIPLPDAPTYSASKSAVLNYGLALRSALRQSGIGISVICPGYVTTPMLAQESGPKPFAMSAERAAELIMQGLQRNRSIIQFPLWFALATRLGGLMPEQLLRWTMLRFTVDIRREPH